MASCFRLFVHFVRRADSRAACTAGNKSATSTPMMAMTTRSSTSVKAARDNRLRMTGPHVERIEGEQLVVGRQAPRGRWAASTMLAKTADFATFYCEQRI